MIKKECVCVCVLCELDARVVVWQRMREKEQTKKLYGVNDI